MDRFVHLLAEYLVWMCIGINIWARLPWYTLVSLWVWHLAVESWWLFISRRFDGSPIALYDAQLEVIVLNFLAI